MNKLSTHWPSYNQVEKFSHIQRENKKKTTSTVEIHSEHFSVPWHLSSCDFLLTLILHVNAIIPFYMEKIDTGTLTIVNTAASIQAVIELFQAGIKKVLFSQLKCARELVFEVTTTTSVDCFPLFWGIRSQDIQSPTEESQKTGKKKKNAKPLPFLFQSRKKIF